MNKERIRDRILRNAAKIWGLEAGHGEESFDPIVSLLLSATSSELEKLNMELENSRSRIVERLFEILLPDEISGVMPSRSILQVYPIENNQKISLYSSFKTIKKNEYNADNEQNKDIYFGPTIEAVLTTASIKYVAYENILQRVENYFYREDVKETYKKNYGKDLWMGLSCPHQEDLENLLFYFDVPHSKEKFFFHYLKHSKVFFGDLCFELKPGYNVPTEDFNVESVLRRNYSNMEQVNSQVNAYYHNHFFTLEAKLNYNERLRSEAEFKQCFMGNIDEKIEDNIIWLKFQFPEGIDFEILKNMRVALNCVPMINKRHLEVYHKLKDILNIIPLESRGDVFLDLDKVVDDKGNPLDLRTNDSLSSDTNLVVLRKGGVSRFDKRSASELLQYLLELLKDETASFSGIGGDTTKEIILQINQNIMALGELAKEKDFVHPKNPYLIINNKEYKNSITSCCVLYWTCAAQYANGIKPGTFFNVQSVDAAFFEKPAIMVLPSVSGRGKLSTEDRVLEYRNALLTRGRVVTIGDIKVFGLNHFKDFISSIEVKTGTKKEISLKKGFSKTIDIILIRKAEILDENKEFEWEYLCSSFLLSLKRVSSNIYPYRLFESNKNKVWE